MQFTHKDLSLFFVEVAKLLVFFQLLSHARVMRVDPVDHPQQQDRDEEHEVSTTDPEFVLPHYAVVLQLPRVKHQTRVGRHREKVAALRHQAIASNQEDKRSSPEQQVLRLHLPAEQIASELAAQQTREETIRTVLDLANLDHQALIIVLFS